MRRGALFVVGFFAVCLPVFTVQGAFETPIRLTLAPSDLYSNAADSASLVRGLEIPGLANTEMLSAGSDQSQVAEETDFLPIALIVPSEGPKRTLSPYDAKDGKDSLREVTPSRVSRYYYGGEVGFLYGSGSGGRRISSGDEYHAYVIGEVGDDKTHIVVGAAFQESNYEIRRGRGR